MGAVLVPTPLFSLCTSPPQAEAFSLFPRVPSRARTGVIASRAASRFYRPGSLPPPPRSTMATQDTRRLRHARRTCRTCRTSEHLLKKKSGRRDGKTGISQRHPHNCSKLQMQPFSPSASQRLFFTRNLQKNYS